MKIKKRSGEFRGRNWCAKAREYDELSLTTVKNHYYDNAVIAKEIIRGYLNGEYQIDQFPDLVSQGIEDDYIMEKAGKARQDHLVKLLTRVCKCEHRTALFPPSKELEFEDYIVSVKPDAVFDNGDSLDLVIYRIGKPDISMKGDKRDHSVKQCLELYFLLKYGQQLLQEGEVKIIRANYYFLRRKDDTAWKDNFFEKGGGNIVYLEQGCIGGSNDITDIDREYLALLEAYAIGQECSEDDCKKCTWSSSCNYVDVPEHNEKRNSNSNSKGNIIYSEEQLKVINFRKGICRVNAGAGSGKTECVTERCTRMIQEGTNPSEILCITFTNAGAQEMKERISRKCRNKNLFVNPNDIKALTFNSFAYEIVKDNYRDLGFTSQPIVMDDVRNSVIVTRILDENPVPNLDYLNYTLAMPNCRGALDCAKQVFEIIKTENLSPNNISTKEIVTDLLKEKGYYSFMDDISIAELIRLYPKYDELVKADNLIQFSDQEPMMFKVLELKPDYFEKYNFKHLIIDEFQDTSEVQLETIRRLFSCKSCKSLMVVGDDSQSIYGFRHTSSENILHFFEKLGLTGEDFYLVKNRRSIPEVIDFANKINSLNEDRIEKDMIPTRKSGKKPVIRGYHGKDEEYDAIAQQIHNLIVSGTDPEDIAFIAYKKTELIKMGAALEKINIPWIMKNPMPLIENMKVKAALSLAEAFWQPEAEQLYFDYLNALYEGNIFEKFTIPEIREQVLELKNMYLNIDLLELDEQKRIFHELLDKISSGDEIYQYYLELLYANPDIQSELEYARNFARFGERTAKKMEQDYKGVVLTTAHSSKGLEWNNVFLSLTNFDSKKAHVSTRTKEREEIRRLIFVAATRARDQLWITGQYVAYGPKDDRTYNQFLRECFEVLDEYYDPVDPMEAVKDQDRKNKAAARRRKSISSSNEMTEEQKEEYRRLTKNSYQLSFV